MLKYQIIRSIAIDSRLATVEFVCDLDIYYRFIEILKINGPYDDARHFLTYHHDWAQSKLEQLITLVFNQSRIEYERLLNGKTLQEFLAHCIIL